MAPAFYEVSVGGVDLPTARDAPVIFHGVNKSGSLSISTVLMDAYYEAFRAHQFFSTYHKLPENFEHFTRILARSTGANFFVAHYIYKAVPLPAAALLVSQIRHPLPRTLSVYSWLKRRQIKQKGDADQFPSLEKWVRLAKGRAHTQMVQFALGFGPDKGNATAYEPARLREMALENLEKDFAWFGIAEHLEESIFALASICGLPAVPPWEKDDRNAWRVPLDSLAPVEREMIEDRFREEFAFYAGALKLFQSRIRNASFGPAFAAYQAQCLGAYRERIIDAPSTSWGSSVVRALQSVARRR